MFHLEISKNRVNLKEREVLVSGASKSHLVQFAFSSDWEGLNRTAVFRAGEVSRSEVLSHTNQCHIPWEVLEMTGRILWAGVEGTDGEGLVLPTVWCALGCISPGAHPGDDEAQPPTPDVYSQLLAVANKAAETAKSVRDDADAGKFDGADGKDGVDGKDGAPGADGADAPQINDAIITDANPWSAKKIVDTLAPPLEASGAVVTCNPVAGYPLEITSQIVPVQAGNGDPSPDNVRPIRGWTEANLWVAGKNLIGNFKPGENDVFGVAWSIDSDSISAAGTASGGTATTTVGDLLNLTIKKLSQATYVVSYKTTDSNITFVAVIYSSDGTAIKHLSNGVPYTLQETGAYMNVFAQVSNGKTVNGKIYDIQLEINSVPTPYESYHGSTITLPIGQTVYGGTLNWTTGVLTVDKRYLTLKSDSNIAIYPLNGTNGIIFGNVFDEIESRIPGVCSHALVSTTAVLPDSRPDAYIWLGVNSYSVYWVRILDVLGISTVDEFKQWLDTQNVQIVCPLNSPITIQLTPTEVLALFGTTTIYTDTGDTTVSGRADPNTILQQLAQRIATLEGQAING